MKQTSPNLKAGFSLAEIITVLGIIGLLAGALIPLAGKNIEESQINRATQEMEGIKAAIASYVKDVGRYPPNINALTTRPNGVSTNRWNGPYVNQITDPWENNYTLRACDDNANLNDGDPVLVLSPGRDGGIDTAATATVPANGDLGMTAYICQK